MLLIVGLTRGVETRKTMQQWIRWVLDDAAYLACTLLLLLAQLQSRNAKTDARSQRKRGQTTHRNKKMVFKGDKRALPMVEWFLRTLGIGTAREELRTRGMRVLQDLLICLIAHVDVSYDFKNCLSEFKAGQLLAYMSSPVPALWCLTLHPDLALYSLAFKTVLLWPHATRYYKGKHHPRCNLPAAMQSWRLPRERILQHSLPQQACSCFQIALHAPIDSCN
jgi:hypothetical protein